MTLSFPLIRSGSICLVLFYGSYHHHHHHYVVPLARISLTLALSLSLSRLPFISFVHRFRQVLQTTSYVHTELFKLVVQHLLVFVKGFIGERHLWVRPYFSVVSHMSCSSDLDGFRDGRQVAEQLLFCGM